MNHRRDTFFFILFVLPGILFWQPDLPRATAESGDRDIIFYYSNDVHGETEPCG